MARPQKYTDADIASAIESLIAEGRGVNPTRVRQHLGGGNSRRIQAIIDQYFEKHALSDASMTGLPTRLLKDIKQTDDRILELTRQIATKCWAVARDEATSSLQEKVRNLQERVEATEADLARAAEAMARLEVERSDSLRERDALLEEKSELSQRCDQLTAALRNAESDLRASERTISVLERAQRQDRNEIRELQKRIEGLVAELATLKASR